MTDVTPTGSTTAADLLARIAARKADITTRGASGGSAKLSLTDTAAEVIAGTLDLFDGESFRVNDVPEILELVPNLLDESRHGSQLGAALRSRYCKAEGGNGRYVWVSAYVDDPDPANEASERVVWLQVKSKVSKASNAYKGTKTTEGLRKRGLVEEDGTPIGNWHLPDSDQPETETETETS